MVVGAHSADFVWRAGGAVAVATSRGGEARVLALSYGERGESGELWKEPGQTVERVKEIRHGEAPDDFIDPRTLNPLARSYLREAFRAVASVQASLSAELSYGVRWG